MLCTNVPTKHIIRTTIKCQYVTEKTYRWKCIRIVDTIYSLASDQATGALHVKGCTQINVVD